MKKIYNALATIGILTLSTSAMADSITPTISTSEGTTIYITELSALEVSGADMAGMLITAAFADGSSSDATWMAGDGNAGGASGTGWSLDFTTYSTWNNDWALELINDTDFAMTGLKINALPGNTVFDIVFNTDDAFAMNTPDSYNGRAIEQVDGPSGLTVAAEYTNQVAFDGKVYGDLFAVMMLDFGGDNGGLISGDKLTFWTDTDNIVNPVPIPGGVFLFGSALLGLFGFKRSKP